MPRAPRPVPPSHPIARPRLCDVSHCGRCEAMIIIERCTRRGYPMPPYAGTDVPLGSLISMTEPLPLLMENSIQIAWDYLEGTDELGDAEVAARFLTDAVEIMIQRGETRKLMLANRAIDAYQR